MRATLALALVFSLGMIFNPNGTFYSWNTHRDMLEAGFGHRYARLRHDSRDLDRRHRPLGRQRRRPRRQLSRCSRFTSGWAALPALAVCVGAGALCGLASGGLISIFSIQPFIATLAMMVFARGSPKFASGGQKISTALQQADGTFRQRRPSTRLRSHRPARSRWRGLRSSRWSWWPASRFAPCAARAACAGAGISMP